MSTLKSASLRLYVVVFGLAGASSSFATGQSTPPPYSWPWWHDMPWPAFGWIFPLLCVAFMVVMFFFMMRRGGIGCMRRGRSAGKPGLGDSSERSRGDRFVSALDILNERYVRGEIDKHEYDEKKAAIASST